jgi:pyruvate ferredoxin oxidoreductase gamma subunit
MIGVRLAGRGGQGIKSAAHIIGTAAFLSGRHVQDQPAYGAERRGAPITAHIRISDEPILDRGYIEEPALLVIADESLLSEGSLDVLAGVTDRTVVLVNTPKIAAQISVDYHLSTHLIAADLSHIAEETLKRPVVGPAVAGATGRLLGLPLDDVEQALTLEFEEIGLAGEELASNARLVRMAYESQSPLERLWTSPKSTEQVFVELAYDGPEISTCSITSPGNARERNVGEWSRFKPVINYDKCTRCRICFVYCPDSAITIGVDDLPVIDYNACKGCDICYTECPVKVISLVRTEK